MLTLLVQLPDRLRHLFRTLLLSINLHRLLPLQVRLLPSMQTGFATPKLARNLHQTLAALDHHLHCLAFVLLRINRLLFLFCFHRVLSLSLSSRVRQIGGGSDRLRHLFRTLLLSINLHRLLPLQVRLLPSMQTGFATPKLARNLHQTLAAVDHHLHCLAFVLLRINRLLFLFCFHRVLSLSLSSRVRQIGGGSSRRRSHVTWRRGLRVLAASYKTSHRKQGSKALMEPLAG